MALTVSLAVPRADSFIGENPNPSRDPNRQKQGMGEFHIEAADLYDVPIPQKVPLTFSKMWSSDLYLNF